MNKGVFRQYLLSLVIPLGVLTLAAGALQTWSTLRSTLRQVEITQLAQAQLAAARIASLEEGTEAMVRDFAALPWDSALLVMNFLRMKNNTFSSSCGSSATIIIIQYFR